MSEFVEELFRKATVRPSRPLDVDELRRRARRRTATRRMAVMSIPVVAVVALVGAAVGVSRDDSSGTTTVTVGRAGSPEVPGPIEHPSERDTSASVENGRPTGERGMETPRPPAEHRAAFTDPVRDTAPLDPWAIPGTTRNPEPMLDITGGSLTASTDTLVVEIELADLDQPAPPGADGAAYAFGFNLRDDGREIGIGVDMQRYNGHQAVRLLVGETVEACRGCTLEFDAGRDVVAARIPATALDAALRARTDRGLEGNPTFSSLRITTQWVHTQNNGEGCADPDRGVGCPPGPYAAAEADTATTTDQLEARWS